MDDARDKAIIINNIKKNFIPSNSNKTIKQLFTSIFKQKNYKESAQTVLKGVSFEIKKGDFFGIVGRNGSGKSTLLKIIAGIYNSSTGTITVNGKLVPFIELGVGFNPELSGKDNVFLNGALLGFNRKTIREMYEDIVKFAELENHMDKKLKNYSSGMQVRLAFSIAVRAKSDILLIDEVLAVGDEAFQKKCFSYFDQLKRDGKTVVLVTHDMSIIERFCNRAVLLKDGKVLLESTPKNISLAYSELNNDGYVPEAKKTKSKHKFKITIMDTKLNKKNIFSYNENMIVRLTWTDARVKNVGVAIFKENGEYVFGPNTYQDGYIINKTSNSVDYRVKLNLNCGFYFLKASINGDEDKIVIDFIENGPYFQIINKKNCSAWGGVTNLEHQWKDFKHEV